MPSLKQRVLVIGPSNIGDAILIAEVVSALHCRFPEAHLTLVVGERATAVYANDPRVQALVNADRYRSPLGRLRLALALWRYQPQIVVDLRHTLYPLLLRPLAAWRYLRRPPASIRHMRDRHLWKLRLQVPAVGALLGAESAGLWVSSSDEAHTESLCRRWGVKRASRLAMICPGARSHIKRWTAEGFARVADALIANDGLEVVLAGEPEEEPVIEEIAGLMTQRAHTSVGLTTIRQLAALMRRAAVVITNDSAALHAASAVQAPTVAIFGPTDGGKYGPTAPRRRLLQRALFCAPCERSLCRFSHECMRFITPEDVLGAARELLRQGAAR
ncbi:MAG: glycosyltransferase family 9 protein [Candidatus Omnitrophica bacterium]|nr:glycosyltransferase family 9 protein [Candidatus Omnitrophota bacterium]